ncbi:MAG TPA: EscN/YscN/HrcN family type III secretion system ATPase [Gammaproteobacteria bacterium]|nr:flagellum-specific ATP synthase FliI [Gammaproteobacteria bacterium]MEC8011283.1 FliI/YscN family ATPase [Pseudomonadota bacterium]HCK92603.1 EscN/YscN/HrcN family type III secretion system ATPase [Gammaproteobacteria bacterium]|tara:strand:- start:475 stop:1752 length:1278 start_codon:yes stop_codon:yes gene_type:complete
MSMDIYGKVVEVVGAMIYATMPSAKIGESVVIIDRSSGTETPAEVVGFKRDYVLLAAIGEMTGIAQNSLVKGSGSVFQVPVGDHLLGCVLDGMGRISYAPDWQSGVPEKPNFRHVEGAPPDPMARQMISQPFQTGVRAIDGFLTVGRGQRLGIFAAAGGGKSTLIGMLMRNSDSDINVICLIGERGREVKEFVEHNLTDETRKKTILVVSTSERPALERVKAAYIATTIAEHFRDQGKNVMLVMDSVTRFARAKRDIGLAAGEPPTRRGFTPSVFSELPRLMERAGAGENGTITAFYTVLVEGDDMTEPVADETRSILDGHIILSRKLAAENHYPAISILDSASRVMPMIASDDHLAAAGKGRKLLAKYQEVELLIRVGEFKSGTDREADEAVAKNEHIKRFLQQGLFENSPMDSSVANLQKITK